jgi:hypothetical protein
MMVNDDIEAIVRRGEERTHVLNSKYEGLNLEDLSNFKSDASVQQWEGEDFRTGVYLLCPHHVISGSSTVTIATQSAQFQLTFPVKTRTQIELLS